jgi:hypothetical protein
LSYLTNLVDFLGTPAGIAALLLAGVLVVWAGLDTTLRWGLVGLVIYATSLQKYGDEWIVESPPFAFPLEGMVRLGRPLAIIGLAILLALAVANAVRSRRYWGYPPAVLYLLLFMQLAIAFKLLSEGDQGFALMTLTTNLLMFMALISTVGVWLRGERDVANAALAIVVSAAAFTIASAYQAYVDPFPLAVAHGRFQGTTGNAQHAAVFLAGAVPAILYGVERPDQRLYGRLVLLLLLASVAYLLYWTGSRTGMAMAAIAGLVVFSGRSKRLRVILAPGIVISSFGLGLLALAAPDQLGGLVPGEDTRTHVWASQLRDFFENPLFGAEMSGDRLGYGENSWLAMAAGVGLVGLAPMLVFGVGVASMMINLWNSRLPEADRRAADMVVAGLAVLLAGSIMEAYLLGNLNAPIMYLYVYAMAGDILLRRAKQYRAHGRVQSASSVPTGARTHIDGIGARS